ncbi:DoxX family protein [Kribbia dieselivorans]|uniref:DoxX family protein n=1 Tax=Kribbia dieselivorans TaxID=331526 RepID=UPI000838C4FA|nr:DoxX family protein [Kribbia dieselivorans]
MNITLWIIAVVLAAFFLLAGFSKVTKPKEQFVETMPWAENYSPSLIKFIGVAEILGALGLILPAAFKVAVILTPLAATGLAIVMLLAMVVHARRGETQGVVMNIVIFLLLAFVAIMRFGSQSF